MFTASPSSSDSGLTRRRVLGAAAVTAAALLAGCRSLPFTGEPVEGGHLFVQNREDRPIEVAISILDRGEDDRVVNAVYRVPANTALQFEGVLQPETTYTVEAVQPNLQGDGGATLDVVAETCEQQDQSGKVDVAVSLSSNGPEIAVFNCETEYTREGDLEYVTPEEYRIGTPTGTITSPTPS